MFGGSLTKHLIRSSLLFFDNTSKQTSADRSRAVSQPRATCCFTAPRLRNRGLWAEVRPLVAAPGICPRARQEVTLTWGRVPLCWNPGTRLAWHGGSERAAPSQPGSRCIVIASPHLLSRLHIFVSLWFLFFWMIAQMLCYFSNSPQRVFNNSRVTVTTLTAAQNCHYQWKV